MVDTSKMTELVLVLCGVVVKTAFKLWIRNDPFADVLVGDLTDMINSRVNGALERRKVRGRFARMEEIVADQLLMFLNNEFRNLDEGEKNAAIIAVTDTLSRAELTTHILVTQDLDPFSLERYIRQFTGTSTRDLSQAGTALYDRILARCCAYIIELADKLPGFQTDAFGELLSRDRQILARLEDVMERLPAESGGISGESRIDIAYRQRIATVLDRLELFGLDFSSKWYPLSIAYINLSVSNVGITGAESLQDQLVARSRLVIKGRAGSGKTTVLQWLAVRAARQDFYGRAQILNGLTPFFLRMREYAGVRLPSPEEFLDKIAPLLAPEGRDWPRRQLMAAGALLLVDGIDELGENQRTEIGPWLREMMDLFPATRCVITTRPGAVDDDMFSELGFSISNLQPMAPAQVRRFIAQWHLAMLNWQVGEQERERTASFERSLLNRIENDRFLRDLADTPLLAGLICALNLHLRAVLPGRRGEIYEKALIMFDQRDRARGISSETPVDLTASNHLLGDLALWMVRNGVAEVPLDLAHRIVARSAASLPNGPYDSVSLCHHLILRSGLLREPTAGRIDFVHKSFQEFLAGKALIAADNVGELIRNANEDQWEQVLILSAGQGNKRQTSDLLLGLLQRATTGRPLRKMRLLAAACMGEIRGAEPEALAELNHAITKLLPPRSIAEAETLSAAGESIIVSLAKLRRSDPTENAAIIRTAALVGGTAAMSIIANIAARHEFDEGEGTSTYITVGDVYGELMRAWEYFDPAAYARTVLESSGLYALTVQDNELIRYVPLLPSMTSVTVESPDIMLDLTPLDDLPDLQSLTIYGNDSDSLENILRNWPSIREVTLAGLDNLRDISALEMYTNLSILQITYCPELRDYTVLGRLSTLETLWLQGQEGLELSIISGLNSLRDLTISEAGVVDLRPLANNEMDITVFDDTVIIDLAGIDFQPDLRILHNPDLDLFQSWRSI
jgi:NACHT domain